MKFSSLIIVMVVLAGCVAPSKKASKPEYFNRKPVVSVEKSEIIKKD